MTFQIFTDNPEPVVFPKDRTRALVAAIIAERAPAVTVEQAMGFRCRHARVVAVRALVWRVMKSEWDWSLPRIGRMFGCHHTTVHHALRKSDAAIEADLATFPKGAAGYYRHKGKTYSEKQNEQRREKRRNRPNKWPHGGDRVSVRFMAVKAEREERAGA